MVENKGINPEEKNKIRRKIYPHKKTTKSSNFYVDNVNNVEN